MILVGKSGVQEGWGDPHGVFLLLGENRAIFLLSHQLFGLLSLLYREERLLWALR